MEITNLINHEEEFLGKEIEVSGLFDRPRKKHSDFLFFNITQDHIQGVQAVLKSSEIGRDNFKRLSKQGLQHNDSVIVTGKLQLRNSLRDEFYKYELIVHNLIKK